MITHPDKRIEERTYAKAQKALYYPPKPVRIVKRDKDGKLTNSVETKADGSKITITSTVDGGKFAEHRDRSGNLIESVTTMPRADGGALAVHRDASGNETKRVETRKDKSTIKTTYWPDSTIAVYKNARGGRTKEVQTNKDKSKEETIYRADGGMLSVETDKDGRKTREVETNKDKSKKETTYRADGSTLTVEIDKDGKEKRKETAAAECSSTDGAVEVLPFIGAIITKKDGTRHLCLLSRDGNKTVQGYKNKNLTSVKLGSKVKTISIEAFEGNKLTKLSIPPSVEIIENSAFAENQLKSLYIPWNVKTIDALAFLKNQLTSLTINPRAGRIEAFAFAENQLREVILSKGHYDKRGDAFFNNPAGIKFYEYDAGKPGRKGRLLGTH